MLGLGWGLGCNSSESEFESDGTEKSPNELGIGEDRLETSEKGMDSNTGESLDSLDVEKATFERVMTWCFKNSIEWRD
jgi:hypothetical protein